MQYWKYLLAARSAVEVSHDSYTLLGYDMSIIHLKGAVEMSTLIIP